MVRRGRAFGGIGFLAGIPEGGRLSTGRDEEEREDVPAWTKPISPRRECSDGGFVITGCLAVTRALLTSSGTWSWRRAIRSPGSVRVPPGDRVTRTCPVRWRGLRSPLWPRRGQSGLSREWCGH